MLAKKGLMTAPAAVAQYVEDVFSTYLYTSTEATQTITNNIDLSGEGGLVWLKRRDSATQGENWLTDTVRGAGKELRSNTTNAQTTFGYMSAFGSSGFTDGGQYPLNATIASWTFRKAEKFFDVVTYTGNGTAGRTISHNLGSVPGTIIVKAYSGTYSTTNWAVYHRSLGATKCIFLNTTDAVETNIAYWNNTEPTSTQFTVGDAGTTNDATCTYVAYLFAHDAGGFGDDGDQSVIKCGSYTGNGSATGPSIDLGWEPQWVLIKKSSGSGTRWTITDNMRGFPVTSASNQQILQPHVSDAEVGVMYIQPTSTGFKVVDVDADVNDNGGTYIYIAIRRGPMKTPESATSVFAPVAYTGNGGTSRLISSGFVADLSYIRDRNSGTESYRQNYFQDRLRGGGISLVSNSTGAEGADTGWTNSNMVNQFQSNTGILVTVASSRYNASSASYINHQFARAPGFMDVVCYTGTGSARTVSHNLGVAPELMIIKARSSTGSGNWVVYSSSLGATKYLLLNLTDSQASASTIWNDTSPTSSVFSVGTSTAVNGSGGTYVAYLFASLSGISNIGTYTGNGSSTGPTVTTGFSPRFLLIKCTSTTGPWVLYDTARGLQGANEATILLNTTDDEYSGDYVDPSSTGFQLVSAASDINSNGATYLYIAIA